MERMKASEFPQELLDEFHLYVHGDINRREFIDRAKKYTVGGLTAVGIFEALKPNFAWAQQVQPDDSRITTEYVTVDSPQGNGSIRGYFVHPANASGPQPGVLVVHENRGLNPYTEDVARRLGAAGFVAFAPDGLTSVGGYPGDEERGVEMFRQVDRDLLTQDFIAAATWMKEHEACTGQFGVVGFCFGGGVSNTLAVMMPDLGAAVPFYGGAPDADAVSRIQAAVLVHHGEADTRLVEGWPAYEAALRANNVTYEGYIYPGAQHGFHNDTTPRYDEAAATLAWDRTLAWFNTHLR
jgi:carboxymethylenebutenolidase